MKYTIALIIIILMFTGAPVSARSIDKFSLSINDFNSIHKKHYLAGNADDYFEGEAGKRAPWCKSKLVNDKVRARAGVLKIDYDVSQGRAEYRMVFSKKAAKVFEEYNAITFYCKGTPTRFHIEVQDGTVHEYIVRDVSSSWQRIVVPYFSLSGSSFLNPGNITSLSIVMDSAVVDAPQGTLFIDDIYLEHIKQKSIAADERVQPKRISKINGERVQSKPYTDAPLVLETRYLSRIEHVAAMRFECSNDKNTWFYVGESPVTADNRAQFSWNCASFESGTYFLRAAVRFTDDSIVPGPYVEIELNNGFDVNEFLDQLMRKSFLYFIQEQSSDGLIKENNSPDAFCTTRACAIGLSAFCVGAEEAFLLRAESANYVVNMLKELKAVAPTYYGFYPKAFYDQKTIGEKDKYGDVMETAYLAAGIITVLQYFDNYSDPVELEIKHVGEDILKNIMWKKAFVTTKYNTFLARKIYANGPGEERIQGYGTGILAYVMACAYSSGYAETESAWKSLMSTYRFDSFQDQKVTAQGSLFQHEFPFLWIDIRDLSDASVSYLNNIHLAVFANREYYLKKYAMHEEVWGITACEGPEGYKEYAAAPPISAASTDGTVAPWAAGASIMVVPPLAKAALLSMYQNYKERLWGVYGFYESFNPQDQWFNRSYTAVGQGSLVLAIENYKNALVWDLLSQSKHVQRAVKNIKKIK